MKKQIVMGILILGIFILCASAIPTNAKINARGTTGNFLLTDEVVHGYFPATDLIINLVNLTKFRDYGILIGANQNISDQQWVNFTATEINIEIKTIHFADQSTAGINISGIFVPNLNQLKIVLYGILGDNDTTPNELDIMWIRIRYYDEQIPEYAISTLLGAIIIMGAITGIFLTIFKYFKA